MELREQSDRLAASGASRAKLLGTGLCGAHSEKLVYHKSYGYYLSFESEGKELSVNPYFLRIILNIIFLSQFLFIIKQALYV